MEKYDPKEIEPKWQKVWEETKLYEAKDEDPQPKFYCLDMFPYPSGEGLHVGHWRGFVLSDVLARFNMLLGKNVLHPMGWDAFGLPAENAAIKRKSHPKIFTDNAIATFKKQLHQIGVMFDWSREINTSDPNYYKWTQWLFLKLYENDLAYRKEAPVNWCPNCQTVLANEQVVSGECERCGSKVIKKNLTQWFFKITNFAEDLLKDLNNLDWPERTKTLQRNWIGKSEGTNIEFRIQNSELKINVFTTRADTLFGCTYVVLSPEHPLLNNLKSQILNLKIVEDYIENAKKKSDLERTELQKEKTGVKLEGIKAINPINNEEIDIYVADYVLATYGTGAVMAVPAHDERDFEFAKKYNIPIKEVIIPERIDKRNPPVAGKEKIERKNVQAIVKDPKTGKFLCLHSKKHNWNTFPMGGINDSENIIVAAKREVTEETGYTNLINEKLLGSPVRAEYFAKHKNQNRVSFTSLVYFELGGNEQIEISVEEKEANDILWIEPKDMNVDFMVHAEMDIWLDWLNNPKHAYTDYGILINSNKFDGLNSKEAQQKITEKLKEIGAGDFTTNYKLRDWLISRQRYWGAPIPIIYCPKCGIVPVPEKDLPVLLPENIEFKPHGESPLKQSEKFLNTTCPKCGEKATRETDTMDTFVDSSWYYIRYTDSQNKNNMADESKIKKWLPVDLYVGGIEHAILHLLYARFISKALHQLKLVNFSPNGEPFTKLFNIGMIYLHGSKMSKSKGNIVSPDELIEKYGTDALRGYELFIGPADQDSEWQVSGITGIYRFLEKVWDFYTNNKIIDQPQEDQMIEKTIKKVTEEIQEFRPNTALSNLMELFNYLRKTDIISKDYAEKINILLAPFFPHLAEEIWQKNGNAGSIFNSSWPKHDETLAKDQKVVVAVQLDGKTKGVIEVNPTASQEEVVNEINKNEKLSKLVDPSKARKIIYIAGRALNFVLK
ncbi:MAG: leucine--tRNA ligase [Patescibacteria group bacterium]|nr:leucine--tRNA ligase [Patescibacteria group bacterium]